MAFDNVVYLISGGVNYYLSGSTKTAYTGSGSPWTAENTTPYTLSLNDGSPIWVPTPAPGIMTFGGGPPLRNGSTPLLRSYDNLTESVGIQMYATSADNAATLIRQLRRILNTALSTVPCILAVQSGTNTAHYEIYGADVQETSSYLTLGSSTLAQVRATITWSRSFVGGRLSTGETLINAATFNNNGTGANNNTQAFGTGGGDLINEGSPLNVKWVPITPTLNHQVWMGSVVERVYSTTLAAPYSTTSTTGTFQGSAGVTLTNQPYATAAAKGRVMICLSTVNTLTQVRIAIWPNTGTGNPIYTSPWITPPTSAAPVLLDMGAFSMAALRATNFNANILGVGLYQRSTTGASATMVLDYIEVIPYYTWALIVANVDFANTETVRILSFNERTNAPALPIFPPIAGSSTGGTNLDKIHVLRGQAPRYYPGASLYVASLDSTLRHNTSASATVTVTHGAAFHTLRGAV